MISYVDALSELRTFRKILVTGPHRSGTTICSRMLDSDLPQHMLFDERDVGVRSLSRLMRQLATNGPDIIHGPCFSSLVQWMTGDMAVVFMQRDEADIQKSQDRIGWTKREAKWQLDQYFFQSASSVPNAVYYGWICHQKAMMQVPYFEIEYESLSEHPLWVPKEKRTNFSNRQWKVAE